MDDILYLDHAATSFPKPAAVVQAATDFLLHAAANPGRSGHRLSAAAARIVYETREELATLLGVSDSRRVLFTAGATMALNAALTGWLRPGDHVVATAAEHNAVMRPLRRLREQRGVAVALAPVGARGRVDPQALRDALRPNTRLVVVNHVSNVTGAIAPLAEIREAIGDVPLLVDGAQSVGSLPIALEAQGIDLLAFSGHKSLFGPPGIGGLCLRPGLELEPLLLGGTGSYSESDAQPPGLPDRHESGTPNGVGIAGLGAGARFLREHGIEAVRRHDRELTAALLEGLRGIDGVTVPGPDRPEERIAVVSFNVQGLDAGEVAYRLDREHGIMTRAGLQCAPEIHRVLGTFPAGTVRVSLGFLNSAAQVVRFLDALAVVARDARGGA